MKTKLKYLVIAFVSLSFAAKAQIKVISGGSVGIGQTSPAAKLDILNNAAGSNFRVGMGLGSGLPNIDFYQTNSGTAPGRRNSLQYSNCAFEIYDLTHTSSRLWINESDGKMGIRTTTPDAYLTISGGKTNSTGITVKSGDVDLILTEDYNTNVGKIQVMSGDYGAVGTSAYKLALNPEGGNVGIGTTSPGYTLDISGTAHCTSSAWSSDRKLKTKIDTLHNALTIINQLKPKSYYFDTLNVNGLVFPSKKQYGFVAQDLEEILPELVASSKKDADYDSFGKIIHPATTFKSVYYIELIAILTKGLQELDATLVKSNQKEQKTIDSLNTNSTKQNAIINAQNAKIGDLQNQILNCCNKIISGNNTENNLTGINDNILSNSVPVLYQNIPNPFNQQTNIEYFIPTTTKSASIMIFDLTGKLINTVVVKNFGKAAVTINGNELNAGMFVYSLIVDGKLIDSKRMILTH